MCDPRVDEREMPMCPCGGELFIVDNEDEDNLLIWGECSECGRTGQKFEDLEEAYEDLYNWK